MSCKVWSFQCFQGCERGLRMRIYHHRLMAAASPRQHGTFSKPNAYSCQAYTASGQMPMEMPEVAFACQQVRGTAEITGILRGGLVVSLMPQGQYQDGERGILAAFPSAEPTLVSWTHADQQVASLSTVSSQADHLSVGPPLWFSPRHKVTEMMTVHSLPAWFNPLFGEIGSLLLASEEE